jgi:hypothetical protein
MRDITLVDLVAMTACVVVQKSRVHRSAPVYRISLCACEPAHQKGAFAAVLSSLPTQQLAPILPCYTAWLWHIQLHSHPCRQEESTILSLWKLGAKEPRSLVILRLQLLLCN